MQQRNKSFLLVWDCLPLPDFPPSARRQQAEGFLWFHKESWQCGLEPQFGPLGGWQTGAQLRSKGKNTSVSRAVAHSETKHQCWRLLRLGGFKQKTSNIPHGQIKMGVRYRASMQRYIQLSLSNGSEQRKNTNDYHCHGNQVGHSSRWGCGWMNDSHVWHSHREAPWSQWHLDLRQHTKAHPCPEHIQNYEQVETHKG